MGSRPLLTRFGSAGRLAILNSLILALVLGAVVAVFIRNFTSSYQTVAASSIGVELSEFQRQALKLKPPNLEAFAADFLRNHALAAGDVVVSRHRALGRYWRVPSCDGGYNVRQTARSSSPQ